MERKHGIVLFADDTTLLFKVPRHQIVCDPASDAISNVVNWFTVNNLVLNSNKTKCFKFAVPNVKCQHTNISMQGNNLNYVDSVVFLGMTLDVKLQCGPHIQTLAKRLASAAYQAFN